MICRNIDTTNSSFGNFDRRARAGERLNVVFFGGSLTWGANATDPQLTSYRALVSQKLEDCYPKAHFKFWDAAVGGTDSRLGVFRLDRDVLRHKPDLVFLEFSANDNIHSEDGDILAAYESIVRRIIQNTEAQIVQVILPFRYDVESGNTSQMRLRIAHHKISEAYNTAIADAVEMALERTSRGETSLEKIWSHDGAHPGDAGYALFADAVWESFQNAVLSDLNCCAPPKMLHSDTYMQYNRILISSLFPSSCLPRGWYAGKPNRISAYYDMLMSRWIDEVMIASIGGCSCSVSGITFQFSGSSVLLFGESTLTSGSYRLTVNGESTDYDASKLARHANGNTHLVHHLAANLDPNAVHSLTIMPRLCSKFHELRLESLCIAGGEACVIHAHEEISQ